MIQRHGSISPRLELSVGRSGTRYRSREGTMEKFDVLVVGAGPAGLGAALMLGRCRRLVLVCDVGHPRNERAPAIHGLLGLDGTPPAKFLAEARREVESYGVEIRDKEVLDVRPISGGFEASLHGGSLVFARKIVLATGLLDEMPPIEGIRDFYGRGVFPCPYCDGYENRDAPIAALGPGEGSVKFCLQLLRWSQDLILFTNGPASLSVASQALFEKHRIVVREEPLLRLLGEEGALSAIVLSGGEVVHRQAIFLKTGIKPRSPLPARLGCVVSEGGIADAEFQGSTAMDGVFVVGDASPRVQLVSVAAAEGAAAAVRVNARMQEEDLGLIQAD